VTAGNVKKVVLLLDDLGPETVVVAADVLGVAVRDEGDLVATVEKAEVLGLEVLGLELGRDRHVGGGLMLVELDPGDVSVFVAAVWSSAVDDRGWPTTGHSSE
jgi:hypothetical protein